MNLLKAASTVSLLTLASRVTGLLRDMLVAATFGASALTDAFNVAFRIPNLLRRLFAEGAFSQAFVPLLAAARAKDGDEATHALINAVATVLFWALLFTCVLGVVGAPLLVLLLGEGLRDSGGFDHAVVMTRWMFPYIGFMSMVALAAGILNTWKKFAVPAATPVLLNLAFIGATVWGVPLFRRWGVEPIYALAAGVMAGGVLQLAVQVPALARLGVLPRIGLLPGRIRAAWHHPGVKHVLKMMLPALLGVSVAQLSLIINTQIATQLGTGPVSWLFYADRLMEFPTGLLGVAVGVVLTPQLSARRASGDAQAYSDLLDWGLRLVVLLSVPCALALVLFPEPLVATLFHRGAFHAQDVHQTVVALQGYGAGLVGLVALKVLAPGFYAQQDMRTPVKVAVVVLTLTQLMNLVFVPWLGHAGLALSIGLGAVVNATWLLVGLRRRGSYKPAKGWWGFLARVLLASAVMGALLWFAGQRLDWLGMGRQELMRAGWMALVLSAAAALYFGTLMLSGLNLRQFARKT